MPLWLCGQALLRPGITAAAAESLQPCSTLCDPIDGSPPGSYVLGFSRQEHWSGLPFPSPVHESEKWKWSRSVVLTLSDPRDCSRPGSSAHGIFQARALEWGAIAFSGLWVKLPTKWTLHWFLYWIQLYREFCRFGKYFCEEGIRVTENNSENLP